MSPEVIRGNYDKRADLWSLGVVTYVLLSGTQPFKAKNFDLLQEKILTTDYEFDADRWKGISKNAKRFIEALIEPDVDLRLTCEQALNHPWIQENKPSLTSTEQAEIADVFLRLKSVKKLTRFQQAILKLFLRNLDEESVHKNLMAFHAIDAGNSG